MDELALIYEHDSKAPPQGPPEPSRGDTDPLRTFRPEYASVVEGGATMTDQVDHMSTSGPRGAPTSAQKDDGFRDEFRHKSLAGLAWRSYPARVARQARGMCEFCLKPISAGDRYVDGGHRRRAHVDCLQEA